MGKMVRTNGEGDSSKTCLTLLYGGLIRSLLLSGKSAHLGGTPVLAADLSSHTPSWPPVRGSNCSSAETSATWMGRTPHTVTPGGRGTPDLSEGPSGTVCPGTVEEVKNMGTVW